MQPESLGDRARLNHACQALGLELSATTIGRLLSYRDLLLRWNQVYNLTAVREPGEMLAQHLVDCLAIVPSLRRELGALDVGVAGSVEAVKAPRRVLDVGSGGGLPGVVLAMVQPQWEVTCVDAVAKKAAFVRQVAGELGLVNLSARHARIETLTHARDAASFDLITSRAFATLADFTRLTRHLLKPAGAWAAMKGQTPEEELAALDPQFALFHVEQLTVPGLDARRCLVWLRPGVTPTP